LETGYGVRWQTQGVEYFRELAELTGFKVTDESGKNEIFHLEIQR
jgi:hypothetical protein